VLLITQRWAAQNDWRRRPTGRLAGRGSDTTGRGFFQQFCPGWRASHPPITFSSCPPPTGGGAFPARWSLPFAPSFRGDARPGPWLYQLRARAGGETASDWRPTTAKGAIRPGPGDPAARRNPSAPLQTCCFVP